METMHLPIRTLFIWWAVIICITAVLWNFFLAFNFPPQFIQRVRWMMHAYSIYVFLYL